MLERRPLFPHVIELNFQARQVFGCNVYLVYDENAWALIDIGYEEHVDELIELIRQMDFPFAQCQLLIATHGDVDHVQGMAKAKQMLKAPLAAHPKAAEIIEAGDRTRSFAEVPPQGIRLDLPPAKVERLLHEGDRIAVGGLELEVWSTPGHTENQLAFRLGDLLFSGDNVYRDGCVGAIDAHHGSNIPAFIQSLRRIRDSDVKWLLPAHGPAFRKNADHLDATIARLEKYQYMADFGTCAIHWPLMDQWEREVIEGIRPT